MKIATFILLVVAVGFASAAVPAPRVKVETRSIEVDLDLIEALRKVLTWMEENDITFADIFSSEFFNSDLFNSDIFNSDYFNSDFFNSDLFNSEIFNRDNFLKVTTALFGLDGITNEGNWQPDVAAEIVHFFELKDWEGLKAYLNTLPPPAESLSKSQKRSIEVDLDLIEALRKVLTWMEENDITFADIFSSEFFNSDLFNSDIFNSDYFNSDFFNSDLFNSEIFNRDNFLKVTTALFGLDGITNEGNWQPDVAAEIVHFFELKDWEGLKQFLDTLPPPAESLIE